MAEGGEEHRQAVELYRKRMEERRVAEAKYVMRII